MQPKVTIIMATYNRAHFIVETLESIQKQTYLNWECLIIDDGGNDNTSEVIDQILNEDLRFKFLKRPDTYQKGLPGCRNYGLDLAKGSRIIFFDDDDIVHPQNLELCVRELENTDIYFCRYIRNVFFEKFDYDFDYSKDYDSFYVDVKYLDKMLKNELPFNSCAVMWKKECFEKNRFVEHLMYAEEWELYSRIISSGYRGISIEKCLFYGRKHSNSNTAEFYRNNPIRVESKQEAILLVVQNLESKNLLNDSLMRYFVQLALSYKKFKLFSKILNASKLNFLKKSKWVIIYRILPFKIRMHKFYKKLIKPQYGN
ncbi:glycosyltransferase family 2 protein [Flavobacterium zhairuonense]|uniref:glycosyltransferase family 2 protein n=1 Tax=Flavobacterium zhairuonense TaxID=2493631 RepID=UPI001051B05C|nr:glycosyltransferase family 2 protein [Flavobacterium zhairuonense]KAF2510809.1 glycosyltransferase family 2 protein [Flavobacterium zhairuonense]